MTAATEALTAFLNRAYAAYNKLKLPGAKVIESADDVMAEFRKLAADDKDLSEAAKARASSIASINDKRCAITRAHKAFLRDALAQP